MTAFLSSDRSSASRMLSTRLRLWLALSTLGISAWVGADYVADPDPARPHHAQMFLLVLTLFVIVAEVGLLASPLTLRWQRFKEMLSPLVTSDSGPTLNPKLIVLVLLVAALAAVLTYLDPHRPTTFLVIVPFLAALFRDMRRTIRRLAGSGFPFSVPVHDDRWAAARDFLRARMEVYGVSLFILVSQATSFSLSNGWQERGAPDTILGIILALVSVELTQSTAQWILAHEREVQAERQQEHVHLANDIHIRIKDHVVGAGYSLAEARKYLEQQDLRTAFASLELIDQELTEAFKGYEELKAILLPAHAGRQPSQNADEEREMDIRIGRLMKRFESRSRFAITLQSSPKPLVLPPSLAQTFELWAFTLLMNVVTHAPSATHVGLSLLRQDNVAELVVEDDGPGFDPAVPLSGLYLLRKQIEDVYKGELNIESNRGTRVSIRVPVPGGD